MWEIPSLNKYFHFSYFVTQLYASHFSNYYIMAIPLSSPTFFIDKNIFTFLIRQSCLYKHSRLSIKYLRQSSRVVDLSEVHFFDNYYSIFPTVGKTDWRMSSKIIPNKLERLTYCILDNYNTELECEGCHINWSSDGSAFMRDQAGAREGMYYRQFRCKGKGKGNCTTSYTHEDFLALATRQLGQNRINEIKSECAFTFSPVKPSSGKRMHDGTSTGLTPMHKRVVSRTTLRNSPPVFSSVFPDCVEKSSVKPFCRVSKYQEIDSLRLNLQKAEVMNEILQEKLIQKDEYISML